MYFKTRINVSVSLDSNYSDTLLHNEKGRLQIIFYDCTVFAVVLVIFLFCVRCWWEMGRDVKKMSIGGQCEKWVIGVQPEGDHVIWEPRGQILTADPVRIESWARDTQPISGVKVVSDDTACKGVQALATIRSRKKIWDKKNSPLWVYVSPSISQTVCPFRE